MEDSADQQDQEKTLVFELPLKLLASKKAEATSGKMLNKSSATLTATKTIEVKKELKKPEMSVNEAIEEFLESDFEILASNAAKKAIQASKRFSMFNPSKLLSPLFSSA